MPTILNLNALEAVARFASIEATRPYLHGVFVDTINGCYVATDGHRLGAWACETARKCSQPLTVKVSKELLKAAQGYRKQFPARERSGKELRLVLPDSFEPKNGVFAKITHDLGDEPAIQDQTPVAITFETGAYPDWLRVVPSQLPERAERGTIAINASYAADFALGKENSAVAFFACDIDKAYMRGGAVLVLNKSFPQFFGLVMPIRAVLAHENELLDAAPKLLRDRLGLKSFNNHSDVV